METKQKVSFIHSITAKIMLMVVVVVALSLTACIVIADRHQRQLAMSMRTIL